MRARRPGQALLLNLVLASIALSSACAHGQTLDEAQKDIRSTYNFDPRSMSFEEQARRSPSLSALWNRYSKATQTYSEALRAELRASGNPELLYCDGGMLLLAKSKSADDRNLGLTSLQKCSLAEIQHTPYFYTLHELAVQGEDVFALQVRILSKPKYSVFIVQHALSLGQDYAFLYPFLVQEESAYVPKLIAKLREEQDPVAQKSLIRALWYAATPEAEAEIRAFVTSAAASPLGKEDARTLLKSMDEVRKWKSSEPLLLRIRAAVNVSASTSVTELRSKRRARMRAISDEALHDLEAYTALIYRARSGT